MRTSFKTSMAMLVMVQSCFGQTNFFPFLQWGGQYYTNVTITSTTPATANLIWDTGGEQVPFTNLPKSVQIRYHYNPQKAQEYLAVQAEKKAATQARASENDAMIAAAKANLGPPQRVRIIKFVYDWRAQIVLPDSTINEVCIHNLPADVAAFVRDLTGTKAAVEQDKNVYYNDDSGGGAWRTRQSIKAANERHLQELLPLVESKTTIIACQTQFVVQGVRQWEFQSMASEELSEVPAGRANRDRGSYVSLRNGIPESVYNSIAAKAAQDWPLDFDEQQYVINLQVNAYRQLHSGP
jgi:hypothetical protein